MKNLLYSYFCYFRMKNIFLYLHKQYEILLYLLFFQKASDAYSMVIYKCHLMYGLFELLSLIKRVKFNILFDGTRATFWMYR